MLGRCHDQGNARWKGYGGRGIVVVAEWHDRAVFLAWVAGQPGHKDLRLELDRIDNDGPYAPWNCRLVTRSENASNTRQNRYVEYEGSWYTITQFRNRFAPRYREVSAVRRQLDRGATPAEIIANQRRCRGPYLRHS
jgi:hypothetical protein